MTHRRCVVLVPAPFQGHITPMLQLGTILQSRGFSIVVAHTEYNAPDPLNHSRFFFLPLPDEVSGYDKSFGNLVNVITAYNNNCRTPLQDYLIQMIEKEELHGQVACIIYDSLMYFVDGVTKDLQLPSIVMRPNSATYVISLRTIFHLQAENNLPLPESQMEETVPGFQPFRFSDMSLPLDSEIPEPVFKMLETLYSTGSSRAIVWNTMDELEHQILSQLHQHYQLPFFCIGPFHKMAPPSQTSLLEEDNSCIKWLDKQAPESVLYVSMGSLATVDEKDLIETAWGLVNSEQPFLWVIRPDSNDGSERDDHLPGSLKRIIGERGCIVKWAPQKKVLAHSAVRGFFSHCGWNSTLESISEGVPMICRPAFTDQMITARYLTQVWNVGLELEHSTDRIAVEKAVRRLMVEAEGKELRKRALDMKHKFQVSVQRGGSSYESLNKFIEFISSLSLKQ